MHAVGTIAYGDLAVEARRAYHRAASAAFRNDPKNAANIRASRRRYYESHKSKCAESSRIYHARSYGKQTDNERRLEGLTASQAQLA